MLSSRTPWEPWLKSLPISFLFFFLTPGAGDNYFSLLLRSKQNNGSFPTPDALSLWFAFSWRLFPVLEQPQVLKAQ